jgi:hypothetical protein
MAVLQPFTGYVRSRAGGPVDTALVELYAVTDLNANTKGASPLATTNPSSTSGRWVISGINDTDSPTGVFAVKISQGGDVKWIEGDAVFQVGSLFGASGSLPFPDNSVSDAKVGNRTVSQTSGMSSNTGTLTALLNGLVTAVKNITGETNWYTLAAQSLTTVWAKFHATTGHKHTGAADDAPKLDPATALTWVPATASHTHAAAGAHSHQAADITSGTIASATNASNLQGLDGRMFLRLLGSSTDGVTETITSGPWKIIIGSWAGTTDATGVGFVNFPTSFSRLITLIVVNGDADVYRGAINGKDSWSSGFNFRCAEDGSRNVRINYLAFGL